MATCMGASNGVGKKDATGQERVLVEDNLYEDPNTESHSNERHRAPCVRNHSAARAYGTTGVSVGLAQAQLGRSVEPLMSPTITWCARLPNSIKMKLYVNVLFH